MTAFGRQMELTEDSDSGRFRVHLDSRWNCPQVTHGGTATAVAVAAMGRVLGESDQTIRSVTAVFAAPVGSGPAVADVSVPRRGRSSTQLSATLRDEGATAGLSAVAVFGAPRGGFAFTDRRPPVVPGPKDSRSWRDDGLSRNVFWDSVEGRTALDGSDSATATSLNASWFRYDEPPVGPDGELDTRAAIALCDTMPAAVWQPMGDAGRGMVVVNTDLTVHVVGRARSEWVLGVNRAHRLADGYASVELELWDETGALVAFATSLMVLIAPGGGGQRP